MKACFCLLSVILFTPIASAQAPQQLFHVILKAQAVPDAQSTKITIRLESGTLITVPISDVLVMRSATDDTPLVQRPQPATTNEVSLIRPKCAADWPDNFQMRAFCEKQQQEALAALGSRLMTAGDRLTIRKKCTSDWPDNFQMRNFCEEQQLEALGKLR